MVQVLLLTGTCGSGKSTIASLLGARQGWAHISEDEVWRQRFELERGAFGTAEHDGKRTQVQRIVFGKIIEELLVGNRVAIDVTLHESPPDGYQAYQTFLDENSVTWALRVLHPRLEVAVARDSLRSQRPIGQARIASLRAKFTGRVFEPEWYLDTSEETPSETLTRLVDEGIA